MLQDLRVSWTVGDLFLPDIAAITHILSFFPFLQCLNLMEELSHLPPDLDKLQLWSIFEPLLELKQIEYLAYRIPLPVSNQKTVRIACAWPHLKGLRLEGPRMYSAGDLSSLESLAHFARHCPDLESLSYPIDVKAIELKVIVFSTMIPPTLSPHPLRIFYIHDDVRKRVEGNKRSIALVVK
ncbi:hypothetical protein BDP27DRAFT_1429558 [Rhodocollybia butyracea]|uniref:Uncharacterized protein n=1 Tax=Rhodocollybia butyracea TaxID=206335 RepID=A0A9P5P8I1_9AGAR|nr:hypothetical protein BDP27DRAFT_1429558 [Rhodocollybia butyracea]